MPNKRNKKLLSNRMKRHESTHKHTLRSTYSHTVSPVALGKIPFQIIPNGEAMKKKHFFLFSFSLDLAHAPQPLFMLRLKWLAASQPNVWKSSSLLRLLHKLLNCEPFVWHRLIKVTFETVVSRSVACQ